MRRGRWKGEGGLKSEIEISREKRIGRGRLREDED